MDQSLIQEYYHVEKVINHRVNEDGDYEYLTVLKMKNPLEDIPQNYIEHIEYDTHYKYYIWILDNFQIVDYVLAVDNTIIFAGMEKYRGLMVGFMEYRKTSGIKVIYGVVYKLHYDNSVFLDFLGEEFSKLCLSNLEEQIQTIKRMKCLLSGRYQIIHNIDSYNDDEGLILIGIEDIINKYDCIYIHNKKYTGISKHGVCILKERLVNGRSLDEARYNIRINNLVPLLISENEIIEEVQDIGVNVIDYESECVRKAGVFAIASTGNNRIGKNSSLRVLPQHLIRQISLWTSL